jgi:transcription elongation factor Elf1
MSVVTTRNRKRKKPVAVRKTGHPAAFRKIRCPKCHGYAVADNVDPSVYACERCGTKFNVS